LPLWLASLVVPGSNGRLTTLFLTMLKIGSVLYGSGYVLFAFLRGDFVSRLGWLTEQQLLDAVAVGQLTPGPLFTSATFVGYLVAGLPGAALATVAIFTPAFVFAALLGRIVAWLRGRWWASAALDGINATALALMLGVALQLGWVALTDPLTATVAVVAALALWRFRLNSAWLILAGAAVGLAHLALT
jgi:chromate transporter